MKTFRSIILTFLSVCFASTAFAASTPLISIPFEGSVEDVSGNEIDGTEQGGRIAYTFGSTGLGVRLNEVLPSDFFPPSGDAVVLPEITVSDLTVSLWVQYSANALASDGSIYSIGSAASTGDQLRLDVDTTGLAQVVINGASILTIGDLSDGQFHHVAVTVSGNTITSYFDGVQTGQTLVFLPLNFDNVLHGLGVSWISDFAFAIANFLGVIDEFNFFDEALGEEDIAVLAGLVVEPEPVDSDGDGILDDSDACPNSTGVVDASGCTIDQQCSCEDFTNNHSVFACQIQVAHSFVDQGLITWGEKKAYLWNSSKNLCFEPSYWFKYKKHHVKKHKKSKKGKKHGKHHKGKDWN